MGGTPAAASSYRQRLEEAASGSPARFGLLYPSRRRASLGLLWNDEHPHSALLAALQGWLATAGSAWHMPTAPQADRLMSRDAKGQEEHETTTPQGGEAVQRSTA